MRFYEIPLFPLFSKYMHAYVDFHYHCKCNHCDCVGKHLSEYSVYFEVDFHLKLLCTNMLNVLFCGHSL